jgi:hypothetical protein
VSRASRAAFFAWSVAGLAGCAAISGLDQIGESQCAPNCDGSASDDGSSGGPEGAADTGSRVDSSQPYDATADSADGPGGHDATSDGPPHADVAAEASGADASDAHGDDSSSDAANEAGDDASPDGGGDASAEADASCGPTDNITNCGACGVSCAPAPSTSVSTASCNGTACTYTCASGHLDCNASVSPNTDGCECATPGAISATCCPSNACPTQHVTGFSQGITGLDQTFYDCSATLNQQVALDACNQYSGLDPISMKSNCQTNTQFGSMCTNGDKVVCNFLSSTQACVCWAYSGPAAGWAVNSNSTTTCLCPAGNASLGEMQYH